VTYIHPKRWFKTCFCTSLLFSSYLLLHGIITLSWYTK
jgi:hypothetical protein